MSSPSVPSPLYVTDLKNADGSWDAMFINAVFNREDAELILGIPSTDCDLEDKIMWHYSKNGEYSVSNGYRLASDLLEEESQSDNSRLSGWWNGLWKKKIPPKVKHFVWKICHSWIPTKVSLAHRGMAIDKTCFRCSEGYEEDVFHALWGCRCTYDIWKQSGLWEQMKRQRTSNVIAFLEGLNEVWTFNVFDYFLLLSWHLWSIRNSVLHGGSAPRASDVFEWCGRYMKDYINAQSQMKLQQQRALAKWDLHSRGHCTINVDTKFLARKIVFIRGKVALLIAVEPYTI
ncbi:hypothetical protein F8388_008350 [Cannabis sativa]|uniref:Reverse transcriptase zinc-binding domain-containing protein n=1 Tax=Cannabis sativa TaxID=3483 RepID=A0A7J6GNP7_CANSA|nr:hypothetical protein F8388_008350 [Cannabis sativa]KAF4383970.1 hypothetical protein G4B88_016403 [Cannabis sativa]